MCQTELFMLMFSFDVVLMKKILPKMNSTQLCRLCLETGAGLVNVFEPFEDSTIASVLATHYWFQVNKDDGMPEWVCGTCWTHTESFHHFYKKLEFCHQKHLIDEIKRERSISPIEEGLAADFVVDEYKEDTEITEEAKDTQILSKESSCDEDDKDMSCDQSDADDEDQPSLDNPNPKSEKEEQDAEIRRFFKMKCDICSDVEFDSLKTMSKHFRQAHKTIGYLKCCGNKYDRRGTMLEHIQYHINPEAYRCDQCGKNFIGKKALEKHIKNHVRAHQCSLCSKAYASALALRHHVQNKHSTDTSSTFHCDICGKTYRTKLSLTGHMRNVHTTSLDHVCETCGRTFKNKFNLKIHKNLEHSTTPLPKVQCDICGAWLKHEKRLKKHFKWHQEMKEGNAKVLHCPICKKKVQDKRLTDHMRSHREGKYQCTFCNKTFKRPCNLKEHIAALHTGVDLYSCTYCDKTFKSNANMYSHRKKAHLVEWTRDKVEKNSGVVK